MRRRRARPQRLTLARAGHRTQILRADPPVEAFGFTASTLQGAPAGQVEIEDAAGRRTAPLAPDNRIACAGLCHISVVTESDTAISILTEATPPKPHDRLILLAGIALVVGGVGWTLLDIFR